MALVKVFGDKLLCVSGNKIGVYSQSRERSVYTCLKKAAPEQADIVDDGSNSNGTTKVQNSDEGNGSDRILALTFSSSQRYLAVCDDWKQLQIWDTGSDTWTLQSSRVVDRRGLALTFTPCDNSVLIADKSGNVYRYSRENTEAAGELLLGHLSMLLDITLCGTECGLVATSDRDEKIRVSCYPNSHTIHSFCMGHTEYVSRLCYLKKADLLLSSSGDGTCRLWDYRKGRELVKLECKNDIIKSSDVTTNGVTSQGSNARINGMEVDEERGVVILQIEGAGLLLVYRLDVTSSPPSFTHIQTLDIQAQSSTVSWRFVLDTAAGLVWTCQPDKEQPVCAYTWQAGSFHRSTDAGVLAIVDTANTHEDFFTEAAQCPSQFSQLHKSRIDAGLTAYMDRKKIRLEKNIEKQDVTRKKTATADNEEDMEQTSTEPAEKKSKLL